jgi:hypothetical protein
LYGLCRYNDKQELIIFEAIFKQEKLHILQLSTFDITSEFGDGASFKLQKVIHLNIFRTENMHGLKISAMLYHALTKKGTISISLTWPRKN